MRMQRSSKVLQFLPLTIQALIVLGVLTTDVQGGSGGCTPGDCNDGNPCTDDELIGCDCPYLPCIPICSHTATSGHPCDDGNVCTGDDRCSNGTCVGLTANCGHSCDDGNPCTTNDICTGGPCCSGTVCVPFLECAGSFTCNDGNACTLDSCDPATGGCVHAPATCSDGNPCTQDSCDPATGCKFDPAAGAPCSDGNACTVGDLCAVYSGLAICQPGVPINCSDGSACTLDSCDPATGGCVHAPVTCSDGNACTYDICDPATGCRFDPVVCNDQNVCTLDSCNPSTGQCVFAFVCNDGNACTIDTCDPLTGACEFVGPPGEVQNARFIDFVGLTWDALPDALIYNTYLGVIPLLGGMGSFSGPYNHECFESADSQANGATLTVDESVPPESLIFYYLVDGELSCGEGTLGEASNGTMRPNPFPCPTPPP